MFRFADQLVRHVFEKTGYIPNLRNHHVKPGVILSKRRGAYEVEGTLWQRVEQAGETELAARIRVAMEGVDPAVGSGDSTRHAVGLRFESEGITAVASKAGVDVTIPFTGSTPITVDANMVLQFDKSKAFIFDTTGPATWFTFDPTAYPDLIAAAVRFMRRGEYLVTGAAHADTWIWYISRSSNTKVAFAVKGAADLAGLGLEMLATLKASGSLSVVAKSAAVVDGSGQNSVACFTVRKVHTPWIGPSTLEGFLLDGKVVSPTAADRQLALPDVADVVDLMLGTAEEVVEESVMLEAKPTDFGQFEGDVEAKWLVGGDDRTMELLADFHFVDGHGTRWSAPRGSKVDGASIPGLLWTFIGPPFVGPYRRASVVHDVHCVVRSEPWRAVHRMFHDACRADGLGAAKARVMYAAVYLGGPRWPSVGEVLETLETAVSTPDISTWRQVEAFAMGDGTDLDAIDQFIDAL